MLKLIFLYMDKIYGKISRFDNKNCAVRAEWLLNKDQMWTLTAPIISNNLRCQFGVYDVIYDKTGTLENINLKRR